VRVPIQRAISSHEIQDSECLLSFSRTELFSLIAPAPSVLRWAVMLTVSTRRARSKTNPQSRLNIELEPASQKTKFYGTKLPLAVYPSENHNIWYESPIVGRLRQ
jgi:hypothetical protein